MTTNWQTLCEPWRACFEEGWAAYRAGSHPIAAAIADGEGRIVSRGRGRQLDATAPPGVLFNTRVAHAEMNALAVFRPAPADAYACTLYATTEPCPMCVGAICMSHVRAIRYASRDPFAGSVSLIAASPYMSGKGIRVTPPDDPILEAVQMALQVEFYLRWRGADWSKPLFAAWAADCPDGVALGEALHASGRLAELRAEAAAGEAFNAVADALGGR
ncbi:MAG TPA: nucleoside deaminase [Armatimonadota bacterium]|jgi:tRNA(adenine34) deaminase